MLIGEAVREARGLSLAALPRVLEMCAGAAPVAALVARSACPGAFVADVDDAARRGPGRFPAEAVLHLGDGWAVLPPGERFT